MKRKYKCKRCKSGEYVKAGFVKTEQRYKCKKCGCQFMPTRNKGRSKEEKLMAVWLYSHELSFRAIAKLLKISARSVFVWVIILSEYLIQIKSQTYLIESNNFYQPYWLARFGRKICCVSRSLHMLDLTIFLFTSIHVNNPINLII